MIDLIFLAAAAATPVPIDPGSWVGSSDYPPQAMREGVQGKVGVSLEIDRGGSVRNCIVTQSSGTLYLDQATCRLLERRARFQPIENKRVSVLPYRTHIAWRLPTGRDIASQRCDVAYQTKDLLAGMDMDHDGRVGKADWQAMIERSLPGIPEGDRPRFLRFIAQKFSDQDLDKNGYLDGKDVAARIASDPSCRK